MARERSENNTYHIGIPVGGQAVVVQLSERNGRGRSGRVGFIESSRGGRRAGVSNVDVSIRDVCD
jgi:hypothetical protein